MPGYSNACCLGLLAIALIEYQYLLLPSRHHVHALLA